MKKIAVISTILENPPETQGAYNDVVADFTGIVKGRMGIPFADENISVIALTVVATLDEINTLTGKLGSLENVQVKTAISKKEI